MNNKGADQTVRMHRLICPLLFTYNSQDFSCWGTKEGTSQWFEPYLKIQMLGFIQPVPALTYTEGKSLAISHNEFSRRRSF